MPPGALDSSRAVIDNSRVRAVKGGPKPARARWTCPGGLQAPRDHRRARDPAGRVADRRQPQRRYPAHALDHGDPAGLRSPRPARQCPEAVYADQAYDYDKYRRQVRQKGVTPVIARRGTAYGSGLGVHRWAVEQSIALLYWFRRLRIRWEISDDIRRRSSAWPAPSSAGADCGTSHFVRPSYCSYTSLPILATRPMITTIPSSLKNIATSSPASR